jgi:glucose/arabinose dehydrogenase
MSLRPYIVGAFLLLGTAVGLQCRNMRTEKRQVFQSAGYRLLIDTLATELNIVFGMDWLPDGTIIFSERKRTDSSIGILNPLNGKITRVCNAPAVFSQGDGGMLDILLHPRFAENKWIYFSYSKIDEDSLSTLMVERAKLERNCLSARQVLLEIKPRLKSSSHFGNRLLLKDSFLFITMGERFIARDSAQSLSNHFGKILRIYENGSVPPDNPFDSQPGALPEIWSYGHRNPQGLAIHPRTGELGESEHGPQGGDEVNILQPGHNYGWPVITYGEEYGGGKIGAGITEKEGMEQPVYKYVPSIAPCGMMFYTGDAFPKWKGSLFLGALALRHLNRLEVENNKIVNEERLFSDQRWRVRVIKQGPDGFIYFAEDSGMILRLRPLHEN